MVNGAIMILKKFKLVPISGDASYRKYYIMEKRSFATWKNPAKTPEWYNKGLKNEEINR